VGFALAQGANEYAWKDRPGHLGRAPRRALGQGDHNRTKGEAVEALRFNQFAIDRVAEPVFWVRKDGRYAYVNDAGCRLLGYRKEELLSMSVRDVDPRFEEQEWERHWDKVREKGHVVFETTRRRKDGRDIPVELSVEHQAYGGEEFHCTFARDIRERKRNEALREAQLAVTQVLAQSATLTDATPRLLQNLGAHFKADVAAIWQVDEHAGVQRCLGTWSREPAAVEAFVRVTEQSRFPIGRGIVGRIWENAKPIWISDLGRVEHVVRAGPAAQAGLRSVCGFPIVMRGEVAGVVEFYFTQAMAPAWELDELFAAVGSHIGQFIERVRQQASLRLRERAIDASTQCVCITDPHQADNPVIYASKGFERVTGYRADELVGRNLRLLQGPDTDRRTVEIMRECVRHGRECVVEVLNYRKDGTPFWNEVSITPVRDDAGHINYFVGVHWDVTERKEAEAERARLAAIVEATPDFVCIADWEGRAEYINKGGRRILDIGESEDVRNACLYDYVAEPARATLSDEVLAETLHRGFWEGELTLQSARKRLVPVYGVVLRGGWNEGTPEYLAYILHDISEWKRSEEKRLQLETELRQAQKMEALGQLAGGVAHDFNNLLTAIMNFAAFARQGLPEQSQARADIDEVISASRSGAELVSQLLAFSRRRHIEPTVLDLYEVVAGMEKMIRRLIGEDVELDILPSPEHYWVNADRGQIEQVIINLAVNARDAMPGGGRLKVRVGHADVSGVIRSPGLVHRGRYVKLTVSDSGMGMAPEVQSRIFEPFFTTKLEGKGTGLGLSTVYGIIEQHGGFVDLNSVPGKGTSFHLYLPEVSHAHDPASTEATDPALPVGSETILLVEDQPQVRQAMLRTLLELGYDVLTAGNGEEALQRARAGGRRIDLTITDVIMPAMDGCDLVSRIRKERPDMKVIFISGYMDGRADRVKRFRDAKVLMKPISPDQLAATIRGVLGDPSRAAEAKKPTAAQGT